MWSTRAKNHRDTQSQREHIGTAVSLLKRFRLSVFSLCLRVSVVFAFVLFGSACRQDMHDQPKYKPLRPAETVGSFEGSSSRPLVEGTVARGLLRENSEFYTGRLADGNKPGAGTTAATANSNAPQAGAQAGRTFTGYVTSFPIEINREALDRGEERFNIYCSVCHGRAGDGKGMVALRGFRTAQMPSFHTEDLRKAPPGYFFNVMTEGLGTMPSYASAITPEDRWKVIAYIRALQLSQGARVTELPPALQQKINSAAQSGEGHAEGEHK